MTLVVVPEHRAEDIAAWREEERRDLAWPASRLRRLVREAAEALIEFRRAGPCYAGFSGGKDSVVLASLVAHLRHERGVDIPIARVRCEPIENPHVDRVRDELRAALPWVPYHEVEVWCRRDEDGWHATGTLEEGFGRVAELLGADRYVSGIRAEESASRRRRVSRGLIYGRSCAPLGRWTARDVYAYLAREGLPAHPAYAMSLGGRLDRDRLRVSFLGLTHGRGMGREEIERAYYGWRLDEIEALG